MITEQKFLSYYELKKLSTHRLLALLKKVRTKTAVSLDLYCYDVKTRNEKIAFNQYFELIKLVLSKREHSTKFHKGKKHEMSKM